MVGGILFFFDKDKVTREEMEREVAHEEEEEAALDDEMAMEAAEVAVLDDENAPESGETSASVK